MTERRTQVITSSKERKKSIEKREDMMMKSNNYNSNAASEQQPRLWDSCSVMETIASGFDNEALTNTLEMIDSSAWICSAGFFNSPDFTENDDDDQQENSTGMEVPYSFHLRSDDEIVPSLLAADEHRDIDDYGESEDDGCDPYFPESSFRGYSREKVSAAAVLAHLGLTRRLGRSSTTNGGLTKQPSLLTQRERSSKARISSLFSRSQHPLLSRSRGNSKNQHSATATRTALNHSVEPRQ